MLKVLLNQKSASYYASFSFSITEKNQKKREFLSFFSHISGGEKNKISPPEICGKNEKKSLFFLFFFVQKTTVNAVIKKSPLFF